MLNSSKLHKNDLFWLKIDCLTLKFLMDVNFFSRVSEGTFREDLGPISAITGKYRGAWGLLNTPNWHENDHFLAKNQPFD